MDLEIIKVRTLLEIFDLSNEPNLINCIMDKQTTQGGSRPGAGAKKKDPQEVKVTVSFQIKRKHLEAGKPKVQALVDKINKK